jgi:hypothetical protein
VVGRFLPFLPDKVQSKVGNCNLDPQQGRAKAALLGKVATASCPFLNPTPAGTDDLGWPHLPGYPRSLLDVEAQNLKERVMTSAAEGTLASSVSASYPAHLRYSAPVSRFSLG